MKISSKINILSVIRWLILSAALIAVVIPLIYLVINSLKLPKEFLSVPPIIFPTEITFEHFEKAFSGKKTLRALVNSLLVSSITTIITVFFATLSAYGLARIGFNARILGLIIILFLLIRYYPRVTTVIPYFVIMKNLGLLDTIWAIIIGHLGITIPFVTWLMLVIINDLPKEIEESAMIEGASVRQRFLYIIVPITSPGIAASAILTAFLSWNEFLIASSVARRKASVLSMSVASYVTDKGILWGQMAAMSIIMILPMILFALFVQKYLIRGITLGAVKQ
jgi:multiple sugar transport system permease protein